ncbi:hypothetical protein T484DRAFT_1963773, partial [Baffinella frigidus]
MGQDIVAVWDGPRGTRRRRASAGHPPSPAKPREHPSLLESRTRIARVLAPRRPRYA